MGIPRLRSHLQAYATDSDLSNEKVVIDGPALAYHVYYLCARSASGIPSCEVVGKALRGWLEELTSYGISVEAIYFDGLLPPEKLSVRLERATKGTTETKLLYHGNRQGCPLAAFTSPPVPSEIFLPNYTRPSRALPANPFIIVAALDALRASHFGPITCVVPGEADSFCALYALRGNTTILTSDSDLLAHDIGNSSVVFIDDIYISNIPSPVLRCSKFTPSVIASRLDLPLDSITSQTRSLSRLAYELQQAPYATLPRIVEFCRGGLAQQQKYLDFLIPYRRHLYHYHIPSPPTCISQTSYLDPRVSELILQARSSFVLPTPESAIPLAVEPRIFLPLLLESSDRESAFDVSTQVRQIAYSLVHADLPVSISRVQEFKRVRPNQSRGTSVDLLFDSHFRESVTKLANGLGKVATLVGGDDRFFWLSVTLWMEIGYSTSRGKESLGVLLLQRPLPSSLDKWAYVPWDLLHFKAQAEAYCYSFRVLAQILDWVTRHGLPSDLVDASSLLRPYLSKIPSLVDFPDARSTLLFFHETRGSPFTVGMFQEFGIQDPCSPSKSKKTSNAPKRLAQKAALSGPRSGKSAPRPSNLYELLPVER